MKQIAQRQRDLKATEKELERILEGGRIRTDKLPRQYFAKPLPTLVLGVIQKNSHRTLTPQEIQALLREELKVEPKAKSIGIALGKLFRGKYIERSEDGKRYALPAAPQSSVTDHKSLF